MSRIRQIKFFTNPRRHQAQGNNEYCIFFFLFSICFHKVNSLVGSYLIKIGILTLAVFSLEAAESSATSQVMELGWDSLKGFGILITKSIFSFILWSVLGLILGAVGGVSLWRWLRNKGWLDVPWGWYKYVRWIWPVLIVASLSLGMSCSIGTWGAGRKIKKEMREGQLIEVAVVNTYSAIMVWRIKGNGADTNGTSLLERDVTEAIAKLKMAAGKAEETEDETREKLYQEIDKRSGGSWHEKWFFRKIIEVLWDQQLKEEITDNEAVEFLSKTLETEQQGGEGAAVKLVISKIMSGVYRALDETVNSVVYPTILTAIGFGIGVPLFPLCLFWFVRWLWLRKHPGEKIDSEEPPVLDAE